MPVSSHPDRPRYWRYQWIAHHARMLTVIASVLIAGASVGTYYFPGKGLHGSPLYLIFIATAFISLMIVMAVDGASLHYHGLALCPHCVTQTPLDGVAEAEKHARGLRWVHFRDTARGNVVYALPVLTLTILALKGFDHTLWSFTGPLVVYMAVGFDQHLLVRHRVLQPWCPQCDWDEGGDEEVVPQPLPKPTGVALT